ncbi:FAR1-related protein [Trifolium pratense]|uniref:FAR1-related protein n=1 Tax=Trifolium pratense TaxID=57577 RepID=A0A2K3N9S8_TRIPR|nr:FAR1-related protein [Trifolium pratense]
MLSSHRKISEVQAYEIEMAQDSGLKQKASFQLMSTHAGGRANLGFTRLDAKNYLQTKRQHDMVHGDLGSLMQYFQRQMLDNPSFYHAYQMDCDEQITNIFWADAKMILDYGYFGDVVSLDTTYCTNRANRPLALFSGFNHYRGTLIFGAALLYDETAESFKWLFETFLKAHGSKKPQTMFTDQAPAMAKALANVMPETRHGLCTWHLMQNGIKNLTTLMKGGSHFLSDFKKCMYEYDQEAKFEAAWSKLVTEYDVSNRSWVKLMYGIKQKWAACHMKKAFTLEMRSTQLSEISTFANSNATRTREWRVLFDPVKSSISCTCRKFESFGILCCHALKVFDTNDVKLIPNEYILKRWTREARNGVIIDTGGNEVVDDPKLSSTHRYKKLCSTMIRLAADVSISESLHKLVEKGVYDLCKLVMEVRLHETGKINDKSDVPIVTEEYKTQASGIKIRPGFTSRRKRLKSWVERMPKKRSRATTVKSKPSQRSKDIQSPSQMERETSTLAQSTCEFSQTNENNFSFTGLLMEQSNNG